MIPSRDLNWINGGRGVEGGENVENKNKTLHPAYKASAHTLFVEGERRQLKPGVTYWPDV